MVVALLEMCEKFHSSFLEVAFWINGLEIDSVFFQKMVLKKPSKENSVRQKD